MNSSENQTVKAGITALPANSSVQPINSVKITKKNNMMMNNSFSINNKTLKPEPSNIHLYNKLFDIFKEIYSNSRILINISKFNKILQNFFEDATQKQANLSNDDIKADLLLKLQDFITNVIDIKRLMTEAIDTGEYKVHIFDIHGVFPTNSEMKTIFNRQIVPANLIICFLTSINRVAYSNSCIVKSFKFGSTKKNSQSKEKILLKNLLCMDKFTTDENSSDYDNEKVNNTLMRDVQIYLPGQIYPDLDIESVSTDTGAEISSITLNNKRNNFNFDFKKPLSEMLSDISSKMQKPDKMHFVFLNSCRNFRDIQDTTQEIYKHELITYSLNLMLSMCTKNVTSGFVKSQSKRLSRFNNFRTEHTLPKMDLLKQIYTLYNNIVNFSNFIDYYNASIQEIDEDKVYIYHFIKNNINQDSIFIETNYQMISISRINPFIVFSLIYYLFKTKKEDVSMNNKSNFHTKLPDIFMDETFKYVFNLIFLHKFNLIKFYYKPYFNDNLDEKLDLFIDLLDHIDDFDYPLNKRLQVLSRYYKNVYKGLTKIINLLIKQFQTSEDQQNKIKEIMKVININTFKNFQTNDDLCEILYNPFFIFIKIYIDFVKETSKDIKKLRIKFNQNLINRKRQDLPRLGRDARAIARRHILTT